MTWTAPRTWVVGETLTAALLNTHIRDNELDIDSRLDALEAGGLVLAGASTGESSTTSTGAAGTLSQVTGLSIPATSGILVILPFRKTAGAAAGVSSMSIELSSEGDVLGNTLTDTANSAGSGLIVARYAPYAANYVRAAQARSSFRNAAGTNTYVDWAATSDRSSNAITAVTASGVVGSASITLATQGMKVYELR